MLIGHDTQSTPVSQNASLNAVVTMIVKKSVGDANSLQEIHFATCVTHLGKGVEHNTNL